LNFQLEVFKQFRIAGIFCFNDKTTLIRAKMIGIVFLKQKLVVQLTVIGMLGLEVLAFSIGTNHDLYVKVGVRNIR